MTKITWEDQYGKYEIETNQDGLSVNAALNLFTRLMQAASYQIKTGELHYIQEDELDEL